MIFCIRVLQKTVKQCKSPEITGYLFCQFISCAPAQQQKHLQNPAYTGKMAAIVRAGDIHALEKW
jgi:hypothetical protein